MEKIIQRPSTASKKTRVPLSFSLLSWNLNKMCYKPQWKPLFRQLCRLHAPTFFLFQELDFHKEESGLYHAEGYHFTFVPNVTLPHRKSTLSGLATLSTIHTEDHTPFFSAKKEPVVHTAKPSLVSRYILEDGQTLLLINIHGINFVHSSHFTEQLEQLKETIYEHYGPAIIGGDLNSWSNRRVANINHFLQGIPNQEFREVNFGSTNKHIKRAPLIWKKLFGDHMLDRFYYSHRSLELLDTTHAFTNIEDSPLSFSDHIPLSMHFKVRSQKEL